MGDGEQRQRDVEVRILDEHIPKLMLGTSNSASRSIVSRQVPMLFKSKILIDQCLNMFDCCSTHMMYIYLILFIYIYTYAHIHVEQNVFPPTGSNHNPIRFMALPGRRSPLTSRRTQVSGSDKEAKEAEGPAVHRAGESNWMGISF